jgi:uncharacterized protein YbgA (DUF1722 family)
VPNRAESCQKKKNLNTIAQNYRLKHNTVNPVKPRLQMFMAAFPLAYPATRRALTPRNRPSCLTRHAASQPFLEFFP